MADEPLVELTEIATHNSPSGATMRSSVSPHGRGMNKVNNATAQSVQRMAAERRAGAVDQLLVVSANALAVVTGRRAQSTRVHHSQINVHSASSSVPVSPYPTN